MGEVEGSTYGAIVARALVKDIGDNKWVYLDRLAYLVSQMEGDKGNYVSLTDQQMRDAMPGARKTLEEKSENQLTIEAKAVKMIDSGRKVRVKRGKDKGQMIPKMIKDENGRVGLHVAYRIVQYKNSSRLYENLERKQKQLQGIHKSMVRTISVALKQQAELENGDQMDFLRLLE